MCFFGGARTTDGVGVTSNEKSGWAWEYGRPNQGVASVIVVPVAPWDGKGSSKPRRQGSFRDRRSRCPSPRFTVASQLASSCGGHVWHSRFVSLSRDVFVTPGRFAKKGKGSFNWRMKFKVSLGPRTRAWKFPYLTVQVILVRPIFCFPYFLRVLRRV